MRLTAIREPRLRQALANGSFQGNTLMPVLDAASLETDPAGVEFLAKVFEPSCHRHNGRLESAHTSQLSPNNFVKGKGMHPQSDWTTPVASIEVDQAARRSPSLARAFVGFFMSTVLASTVMVLLSQV